MEGRTKGIHMRTTRKVGKKEGRLEREGKKGGRLEREGRKDGKEGKGRKGR